MMTLTKKDTYTKKKTNNPDTFRVRTAARAAACMRSTQLRDGSISTASVNRHERLTAL